MRLLVFWLMVAIPTFLMPRRAILDHRRLVGAQQHLADARDLRHQGRVSAALEKIPQGPLIVASKHQSMWETFALLQFFEQPLYILKRELKWIPFFGWYLLKADMIDVERGAGARVAAGT